MKKSISGCSGGSVSRYENAIVWQEIKIPTVCSLVLPFVLVIWNSSFTWAAPSWQDNTSSGLAAYQKRHYSEAEKFFNLALADKNYGSDSIVHAKSLINLAAVYKEEGHYEKAEPLLKEGLRIEENTFGRESEMLRVPLLHYEALLEKLGQRQEAQQVAGRLRAIELGYQHPSRQNSLPDPHQVTARKMELNEQLLRNQGHTGLQQQLNSQLIQDQRRNEIPERYRLEREKAVREREEFLRREQAAREREEVFRREQANREREAANARERATRERETANVREQAETERAEARARESQDRARESGSRTEESSSRQSSRSTSRWTGH